MTFRNELISNLNTLVIQYENECNEAVDKYGFVGAYAAKSYTELMHFFFENRWKILEILE